jgi:SNF2 family DNA or RNA helicase
MQKVKPYVLRRLKKDCLDLPEKLYDVTQVPLNEETWRAYVQMRDRMVTFIKGIGTAMTQHSIVKIMRLAQITNGFIGGIDDDEPGETHAFGREKLDAFLEIMKVKVAEDPNFRTVVWTRFRAEQQRMATELKTGGIKVYRIYGGQKDTERQEAIREFTQGVALGPMALLGQPQAGGFGLNLVTASYCFYMSNDYSLLTRLQSEDRQHRRGQTNQVLYNDMLATGPKGQQTIDHIIYQALRRKDDFAKWTTDHWVTKLTEEKLMTLEDLMHEMEHPSLPF